MSWVYCRAMQYVEQFLFSTVLNCVCILVFPNQLCEWAHRDSWRNWYGVQGVGPRIRHWELGPSPCPWLYPFIYNRSGRCSYRSSTTGNSHCNSHCNPKDYLSSWSRPYEMGYQNVLWFISSILFVLFTKDANGIQEPPDLREHYNILLPNIREAAPTDNNRWNTTKNTPPFSFDPHTRNKLPILEREVLYLDLLSEKCVYFIYL